ncbi:MAG: ATP-dependent Clp protease adaptor ClpS [Deltaproteobacteria bacterium]|nr:ATP-dependent Clp protease adaptor ClpS [Deltaproteobacteria bacterium]
MGSERSKLEEQVESGIEDTFQEPPRLRVLMHNDHYTAMDFVVQVLENVFNKPPAEALQIMLTIHKEGIGVCGVYTAEIAETKVNMVSTLAKQSGFPLKCSMEGV